MARRAIDSLRRAGVYRWFVPPDCGGFGWSEADVLRGYLRLGAACLTTTFIITQFTSALRRVVDSENEPLARRLLPELLAGSHFTTVGISHLTTSRRHLAEPVLRAEETADGFVLDGYSPWVTGAVHAQSVVIGATLADRRQVLISLPTDLPGVSAPPPARLVGLSASATGELRCRQVAVSREFLLAGPAENVMASKVGGKTGGLQTSALALGLSAAAIDFLAGEARRRPDLSGPLKALRDDLDQSQADLLALAAGQEPCTSEGIRAGQQPRPPRHASRAGRRQRNRLCRRPPRRPLVSRSPLLPRLELPPTRHRRQSLRTGGAGEPLSGSTGCGCHWVSTVCRCRLANTPRARRAKGDNGPAFRGSEATITSPARCGTALRAAPLC